MSDETVLIRENLRRIVWGCLLIGGLLGHEAGAVNLEMVTVGNPGNPGDTRYADPPNTPASFGAVGYTYQMSKFEVTTGQYAEFLNAVAGIDTYGLYNAFMWSNEFGCKISRSGDGTQASPYVYDVAPDWANRPVNFVSWFDAARFANWMTNGQPTGTQTLATTEDGSYYLNGEISFMVARKPDARHVIPTEDEWYKAAYYDPNKPGGAGYWDYPTRGDDRPSNVFDPAGTNNANFHDDVTGFTIGPPYYRTEDGEFAGSTSAYGTFDQAGNIREWNETNVLGYSGLRGGSFAGGSSAYLLHAGSRDGTYPRVEDSYIGFRLAVVPEPTTILTVALASMAVFRRKRTRRSPSGVA